MSLTGANTTPLGRLHPILAGKNESPANSQVSLLGQKRQSMTFMPPGGGERKKKKKSRWGTAEEKTYIPGMPTSMPPNLSADQQKAYITQLKIEEISRMLRTGELGIPQNPEERSPSPEPIYNSEGKRLNTREFRVRKNLEEERHNLIQEAIKLYPEYKPPSDYKPPMIKIQDKVMIPQDENPEVNFIGLLIGPRGNTLKKMEKESGAKIMIRGKGSVKEGKVFQQGRRDGQPNPGEDEALHAMVTGPTQQSVKKAVEMIQDILKQGIEAPEGQNDLKRMQLRELAALNGTLRDDEILRCRNCGSSAHRHWECPEQRNVTNNVLCTHCGGAGHVASDCAQKDLPPVPNLPLDRAKMDSEYLSLMAELGEGVPNPDVRGPPNSAVPLPPPPKPMGAPPAPAPAPALPLAAPAPPSQQLPNNFNRMEGPNRDASSSGPPPPWAHTPKPLMSTPVPRPTDGGNMRPASIPPWANKPGLLPVPGTPPRGMGAPPPPPPSGSSPYPGAPPPGGPVPPPPPPPSSGGLPPWQNPNVPPWQNPAAGFAPPPPPGFAPFQPPPPPPPPSDAPWVDVAFLRAARAGNLEKVLNFLNDDGDIHTCNANGLNALHLASKEGHIEVVRELLKRGAAVNATTKKGNTALHIASLAGQKGSVDLLLENGATVNAKAQNGFTPLYMACQEGHVEIIRVLLSNGANKQVSTEDGFTPLDVAVQQGHDKVVAALLHHVSRKGYRSLHTAARMDYPKAAKLLLQKNHPADVEAPNGFTPLHIACKYGNQSVGLVLIDNGATIDYKTKNYVIAPLHVAAKYGHVHMVTLLVEKGSKVDIPNKDGLTPLHCGARDGHDRVVEYLLDKNASVTSRTKHGLTPLHMATQGSHVSTSAVLLDNKAPVNAVAANGLTPLHIAAHYGHVDIAQLLLDKSADTDARARNGFTPLHVACKKNREQVILLLLKYGANVHSANEGGQTPMHVATYYGNVTLVLILLQHGGSPDITNVRGETALHIACRRREIAIVRLLLRNGAAVDAKTQDRETPLHIAVRTRNTEMVSLLLDHGASPDVIDKNKCTPLHTAARDGNEEIVEILLDHDASLTALSKKGFTPLHESARYGHVRVAELLLKHYDTPDPEGKHGLTPLHVATHYDHSDVATLLLNSGADKDAKAKNGYSPLHIGGSKNRIQISLILLNRGVDPDTVTKTGISPLHLSAKEGHVDLCEQLIEHGALPGITTNNGLTSLHLAARENRVDVAKLLLKYNAPIDAQTVSGFTPLHIACVYGNFEVAELLLQNGADIEGQTKNGYMALHLAAQYGHELIIHLLLKYNAPPDAYTKDGYTALYIARRVLKSTTIIETLTQVTKVTQTITVVTQPGGQEALEGEAIVFSAEPEELEEEEEILEALELVEEETEPQAPDESYDRFMTMEEMDMSDEPKGSRGSGLFDRYSGSFLDKTPLGGSQSSDLDKQETMTTESIVMTETTDITESSLDMVNSDLPSSLANMSVDNVMTYEPPVTGGFLISFVVDARGGKMESSQTGIKIVLPPKSCQMPSRITCKLHRLNKPTLLPPLKEGEALASRVLDVGPTGLKFLQPIYLELPHFAALRDGERELVVVRTEDGGWNWQEVSVEDMQGVNGYSTEMNEGYVPTKRYSRIVTPDFPERFAVISRLKKETFTVGARGLVLKSSVVPQVQVSVPEGAVAKDTDLTLQVLPVEESFNDMEEWLAVSSVVTLEPLSVAFKKPVQVTIPCPLHSGNQDVDIQPSLRLLCCFPEEGKPNRTNTANYQWRDITDSTPLTVMNECARFSASQPARYWLIETRNQDNVTSDARLLYRKLSAVPYLAKFVVYAKVSLDGEEVHLRVFCITDDKTEKTLEGQTGYVEVARSRDVEVCEGRPIYIKCLGNLTPVQREPLQLNVTAFHENRLSLTLKAVDSSQPLTCRMAFLKEPRKDRQGNVHAICNLNIDASEESLKKADAAHRLPDNLLALIGKEVDGDWVALGQQLGFEDGELQEISDARAAVPHECATDVLTKWRDKEESEANMASLDVALRGMGREDIANNFKKLAYASYAKDVGVTVVSSGPGDNERASGEADNRRISNFLEAANGVDAMFDGGRSPVPGDANNDAFDMEARSDSPTPPNEEPEEESERDKIIQEMFADDKGVLDFFAADAKADEETEI